MDLHLIVRVRNALVFKISAFVFHLILHCGKGPKPTHQTFLAVAASCSSFHVLPISVISVLQFSSPCVISFPSTFSVWWVPVKGLHSYAIIRFSQGVFYPATESFSHLLIHWNLFSFLHKFHINNAILQILLSFSVRWTPCFWSVGA